MYCATAAGRPKYYVRSRFPLALHIVFLPYMQSCAISAFSIFLSLNAASNLGRTSNPLQYQRFNAPTIKKEYNSRFLLRSSMVVLTVAWTAWLLILLSSDVHPNPGPMDIVSPDHSFNSTLSTSSILPSQSLISEPPDLSHHLSFVHCNVQSLYPKL